MDKLDDYQWKQLRRKHKAHSQIHDLPCWYAALGMCVLDGAPIDYHALARTPYAYECDHRRSRATHPELKYTWANLEAAHCKCNRTHHTRKPVPQQDWVRPSF